MDGGLDEAAMAALREHLGPQHRGKMLFQMGPNGMAQPLGIAGGVPGAEAEGPEPELKLGDPAVVHSLKAAGRNGTPPHPSTCARTVPCILAIPVSDFPILGVRPKLFPAPPASVFSPHTCR